MGSDEDWETGPSAAESGFITTGLRWARPSTRPRNNPPGVLSATFTDVAPNGQAFSQLLCAWRLHGTYPLGTFPANDSGGSLECGGGI